MGQDSPFVMPLSYDLHSVRLAQIVLPTVVRIFARKMAVCSKMDDPPRYMTDCERRLARLWHKEDEISVAEIARRLRRDEGTIWRLLGEEEGHERPGVGRKKGLTEEDKDRLVIHISKLVEKHKFGTR